MGLFDKIRSVFNGNGDSGQDDEFGKIISSTLKEYSASHNYFWSPDLNESPVWTNNVKNWPDEKKTAFILWLLPVIHRFMAGKRSWSSEDKDMRLNNVKQAYVQQIFRTKLVMDDDDAIKIGDAFMSYRPGDYAKLTHWPIGLMLNQLERQRKGQ